MSRGVRRRLRPPVERLLTKLGLHVLSDAEVKAVETRYLRAIAQLCGCVSATMLPALEPTKERVESLATLRGTEPAEGCFILARLQAALRVPGDVCEFGVAQGATSAMLASELVQSARDLWLYDSFEGLPEPGAEDTLIDDPLGLGTIERYAGAMSYSQSCVEDRIRRVGFPRERTHIVAGFVTDQLDASLLPSSICFAYVDFDFYEGVAATLALVHQRLSVGGHVVVDDYGFLSSGAQKATDSFLRDAEGEYEVDIAPEWAGKFCMLQRVGC